jgi:hypothetical protein
VDCGFPANAERPINSVVPITARAADIFRSRMGEASDRIGSAAINTNETSLYRALLGAAVFFHCFVCVICAGGELRARLRYYG